MFRSSVWSSILYEETNLGPAGWGDANDNRGDDDDVTAAEATILAGENESAVTPLSAP